MNWFRKQFYKPALVISAIGLLVLAAFTQTHLNRDRARMGVRGVALPESAPPVLAFTTVALGGFRGLIANALWIRATDLQDEDKFFEMVQLADWITKLQPHFVTVWVHQAWNMAYNISVKFSNPYDRWLWVQRGIELLRDEGLRYNPQEPLIYRELAWFFQHKMGADLDDAHLVYKRAWAEEMNKIFPGGRANYEELFAPQTPEAKERGKSLREKYKLDPRTMKKVDDQYGPFDWRMPEAHAIYWAILGLDRWKELGFDQAKKDDLMTLRRVIYQSMQLAFQRGRFIENKAEARLEFGPNLDIIPNANRAYEDMMEQVPEWRDHIKTGHRNFLKSAVYFLYTHNRLAEAGKWFRYVKEKYPESMPAELSLEEYAIEQVTTDVSETSHVRVTSAIEGLLGQSFYNLAIGEDAQATGYHNLALKVWQRYQSKTEQSRERVGLVPFNQIKEEVRQRMLDPQSEMLSPVLIRQLLTVLGLSATNTPPVSAQDRGP